MNRYLLVIPAVIAITAAAACSGGKSSGAGSGSGSITGTVNGSTFDVKSALTAQVTVSPGVNIQAIVMTDVPDACAIITGGHSPKNAQIAIMGVGNFSGSTVTPPTAPGTFHLFPSTGGPADPAVAIFMYQKTDALCVEGGKVSSSSGTITLSSISGSNVAGTASILLQDSAAGTIAATFSAVDCPALIPLFGTTASLPCQP
jgi:hypothetical protein